MSEMFKDLGEMPYPESVILHPAPPIAGVYAGPPIPYQSLCIDTAPEPEAEFTPPPMPDFGPEPKLEKGLVRCAACGSLFLPAEQCCPSCGDMNPIIRRQQKIQEYNMAYQRAKRAAASPLAGQQPVPEPREEIWEEIPEEPAETQICPACGERVSVTAKFCMNCGSVLPQRSEA